MKGWKDTANVPVCVGSETLHYLMGILLRVIVVNRCWGTVWTQQAANVGQAFRSLQ